MRSDATHLSDSTKMLERTLHRIYSHRFSETDRAAKAKLWRTLHDSFFSRYVPEGGTVLDLGAGYCDFINQVRARRRLAVDLNPDTVHAAAPGVEVLSIPLDRLGEAIEPRSVDLAFASNVFEHMRGPDALLVVLRTLRGVLKPGGRLMIMQPNVRIVGGAFWDFVDHTCPLTEKGMAEALRITDFEIVECHARFLPYTTKSWLPQWPILIRLYLAVPPLRWLMGKQMLVLARRPQ